MKAVFIGCVEFSKTLLTRLLARDGIDITGVVTRNASPFNADFQSLEPVARDAGIPVLNVEGRDQAQMAAWILGRNPDVVFCFGWSYLLGQDILAIPKHGVIGYHPALLPRNRGRHPIIWALALGLEETGSSFFVMDEGADSGDIVSQRRVPIDGDDDAKSLYEKLQDAAREQLDEITDDLLAGRLKSVPQDPALASHWRKRSKRDGEIDWRMPAEGIVNLVRALARPYVGAHCVHGEREYKVWKVSPADAPDRDLEPGRILAVDNGTITVKCGEGAVTMVDHEITNLPDTGACI